MRLDVLLVLASACMVGAMPGNRAASLSSTLSQASPRPSTSSTPSRVSSRTSTSSSRSPTSTLKKPRTDYKSLCREEGRTQQAWNDFNTDTWAAYYANEMTNDGSSFLDYLQANTSGVYSFVHNVGYPGSITPYEDGCTAGLITNPQNWLILQGALNLLMWFNAIIGAIKNAQLHYAMMSTFLMTHFTTHHVKQSLGPWYLTLIAGITGVVSGIIGLAGIALKGLSAGVELAGTIGNIAGGASIVGAGLLSSVPDQSALNIQKEIDKGANTDEVMTVATDAIIASIQQVADNAINQPAWNSPVVTDMYYGNETGLLKMLEGGTFAGIESSGQQLNESLKMTNETLRSIYSIAVDAYWKQEQVYFVNFTGVDAGLSGLKYDDMEILTVDDWERFPVGPDINRGEAYAVLKHTPGKKPTEKYDPVPGVAQLATLGLTLLDMTYSSSLATQKLGFEGQWTMDNMKGSIDFNGPVWKQLFMTRPMCQLAKLDMTNDELVEFTPYVTCKRECSLKRVINKLCARQVQTFANGTVQEWPIKMFDGGWKPR